jgi:hypothetical protein
MEKFCSASSASMDSPAVSFSFLLKPLEFVHVYSQFVWLFEFSKKCLEFFIYYRIRELSVPVL